MIERINDKWKEKLNSFSLPDLKSVSHNTFDTPIKNNRIKVLCDIIMMDSVLFFLTVCYNFKGKFLLFCHFFFFLSSFLINNYYGSHFSDDLFNCMVFSFFYFIPLLIVLYAPIHCENSIFYSSSSCFLFYCRFIPFVLSCKMTVNLLFLGVWFRLHFTTLTSLEFCFSFFFIISLARLKFSFYFLWIRDIKQYMLAEFMN